VLLAITAPFILTLLPTVTLSPGSPTTNAYLLKGAALKTTGSGSYTNLSLGIAAPNEIVFP